MRQRDNSRNPGEVVNNTKKITARSWEYVSLNETLVELFYSCYLSNLLIKGKREYFVFCILANHFDDDIEKANIIKGNC